MKWARRFAFSDHTESPPRKDVLAVTARRHSASRRPLISLLRFPLARSRSLRTFGTDEASVGQCHSRQPLKSTQLHRSQRRKRSGSRLGGFEARRRITRRVSAPVVSRTNFLSSFSSLPFVRANGRFQGQSSNCAIRVTPRTSRQALQERVWPSLGPVHPAAGPNAPCQRHGDGRALPDH